MKMYFTLKMNMINRANKKWESHFFEIDENAILLKDMHLELIFE